MKVMLIGADGQLGTDIQKAIDSSKLICLTLKDLDITDKAKTITMAEKHLPDVIINTAAYTRVDDCEDNDVTAYSVNAVGAKNLAIAAKKVGAVLVHISSDYVFDGKKGSPYIETDCMNPESSYGLTKYAGEQYIKYTMDKYFIIRTSGLFGVRGCMSTGGRNFIEMVLHIAKEKGEIKVVNDQTVSPTYALHLAKKIAQLIKTNKFGTYHITNNGQCTWFDFTKKIFELTGTKAKLEPTTTAAFGAKAKRPPFSVLDNHNLRAIGLDDLPVWQDALKAYFEEKSSA
jgi:dTDP-4-dehydrorhamnose reductase